MRATEKQIKCLYALQNKAERIRAAYPNLFLVQPTHTEWDKQEGMTMEDASIKIDAFHSLIRAMNLKLRLLNKH